MHRTSCFHRNLLCLATLALSACTALAPQPTPTASFTNTPPPTATYTPSPTATNTATLTPTATPTFTPTFTLTPTFTSTSSPTPQLACNVKAGQWSSHETASGFPASLLTFQVYACMVISFDVWDFVIPGELYVLEEGAKTPIENQHFLYKKSEGNGQVIIEGSFDSPNSANGTITYTKGFFYIDFSLSRDAIKKWTASPSP